MRNLALALWLVACIAAPHAAHVETARRHARNGEPPPRPRPN